MEADDYSYLYDTYEIKGRCELLIREFNEWTSNYGFSDESIYLNEDLLFDVVLNYFADIDRLKRFHSLKRANKVKIAAYTASWLARIKPIQIKRFDSSKRSVYMLLNEYFALDVMMGIVYNKTMITKSKVGPFLDLCYDVLYYFHHRHTDPQALELLLTSLSVDSPFGESSSKAIA